MNIHHFRRKTSIDSIAIYFSYSEDESYSPSQLSIRIGSDFDDLKEIEVCTACPSVGLKQRLL